MGFLVEVLGQSHVTTSITLQTCYYCIQAFSPKAEVKTQCGRSKAQCGRNKTQCGRIKHSVGEVKLSVGEVKLSVGEVKLSVGEVNSVWEK